MADPVPSPVHGSFADLMQKAPENKPNTSDRLQKTSPAEKTESSVIQIQNVETKNPPPLATQPSRCHDSLKSGHPSGMTPPFHKMPYKSWKKTLKDTETHNSSFRYTQRETYAMQDLAKNLDCKHHAQVKPAIPPTAMFSIFSVISHFQHHFTVS
jgi:hypothetical protein